MNKPTSSDIAAASADLLYAHLKGAKEQLRNDELVLIYASGVVWSEEDSAESTLIAERAIKEYMHGRIAFLKKEIPGLEEAYGKIIKFIHD